MHNEAQHQTAQIILNNLQFTTLASQMLLASTLNVPLFIYYEVGEAADCILAVRATGEAHLAVLSNKTIHINKCMTKEDEDQLSQEKVVFVFPDRDTAGHVWEIIQEQLDEWVNNERDEVVIIQEDLQY